MAVALWAGAGLGAAPWAGPPSVPGPETPAAAAQADSIQLSSYRPNFFGYVVDAERKTRLDLSVKYPLMSFRRAAPGQAGWLDLFFVYTGIYDFDFQRPSAPLLSRLQEPGFFLRLKDPAVPSPSWYSLGYFHESDGQVLNRTNYFASTDPHREDLISRGWDFVELGAFQRCLDAGAGRFFGGLDLRYYLPFQLLGISASEEDVFWDPHGQGIQRDQYDGVRPSFTYLDPWVEVTEEFRVGYATPLHCANQLTVRLRKIPIGLSWFNGYGEYVSRYDAPGNAVSIGLYLH